MDADKFDELTQIKKKKLIGQKVQTDCFGTGIVAQIDDGRIMLRKRVNLRCGKHYYTVFLTSAWSRGDFANVYNKKGEYLGNLRDNVFTCNKCQRGR